MLKYAIRTAIRHLWLNRLFSAINIIGLVLGFTATFCIASYLFYENSYDRTHPDVALSYRLISGKATGKLRDKPLNAYNFLPITIFINGKIPGIDEMTRVEPVYAATVKVGDNIFIEKGMIWADAAIMRFIDIRFLTGVPARALTEPNSVIISRSEALKLFGKAEAVGNVLSVEGNSLKVTGVYEDMPATNHLRKNLIASIYTLPNLDDPWNHQGYIYVKLKQGADPGAVTAKINHLTKGNLWWTKDDPEYTLQPVRDVHLHSDNIMGTPDTVNIRYLYVFGIIGVLVVFCTAFNYVSLSLSDFTERTKEFGIKNILGSGKRLLVLQPLVECSLLYIVSAVMAVVTSVSLLPYINDLFRTEINISFFFGLPNMAILSGVVIIMLMLSAMYPLLLVSRTNAISVFQKTVSLWKLHLPIRRPLIVMQFAVATGLVFAVIVMQKQMRLLGKENLGFAKDQVVVLRSPHFSGVNAALISQKLKNLPEVSNASVATGTPLGGGLAITMGEEDNPYVVSVFNADEQYIKTLGMTILEGDDLTAEDTTHVIVNEAMVKTMGWKEPIGQKVDVLGKKKEVKAVVKDFQMSNIHLPANPALIDIDRYYLRSILVKLETGNITQTLNSIKEIWKALAPGYPLEYSFLDEEYQDLYFSEIRSQQLSTLFSAIAIIIACLGLYGSVMHIAQQRIKEIGIRKVLGASVGNIVGILSLDFFKLIAISFLIAAPVAWYTMHQWLADFASRIEIKWWMLCATGLIIALLAMLTVSLQAIKAAVANPVKSLKTE
jgi:putative ABC transport system permease protein